MGYLILNPKDRGKFGAPERIEFEPRQYGLRQVGAMEKATGYTMRWLEDQLSGVPALDDAGNPIPVPVLDDDGTPQLDEHGQPKVRPKLKTDRDAIAAWVWMTLWGHGIRLEWDTFDINPVGLIIDFGGDDDTGKDEEPTTDSVSTPST